MLWPALLITNRLGLLLQPATKILAIVVFATVTATVLASEHATSQVAFVGAGVAFLLVRVRPKLAMPLLATGWVAANLLVVPIASALYSAEFHRATWLPHSAQHRVLIWRHASEGISNAPFLGTGIGTPRALRYADVSEGLVSPESKSLPSPSLHSHNAYLQVWYETGAVGAFIALCLGGLILRSLARFPVDVQPHLAATFVACALAVATAYSIWAPWFMATLAMASILASLGAALPGKDAARTTFGP
jgi:O-antigen ligase